MFPTNKRKKEPSPTRTSAENNKAGHTDAGKEGRRKPSVQYRIRKKWRQHIVDGSIKAFSKKKSLPSKNGFKKSREASSKEKGGEEDQLTLREGPAFASSGQKRFDMSPEGKTRESRDARKEEAVV